jgi:predicted N-acyltransferase
MNLLTQAAGIQKESSSYTVHVYERIEEADAAAWDSIVGPDDLQATHRFIRTCQDAAIENALYRHVMIYDRKGPVSVASLCLMQVSLDLLSSGVTRKVIRLLRSLQPDFLRIRLLFSGLPVSFGNSCIRFREGADSDRILELMTGMMNRVARDLHAPVLCFKEFTVEESKQLDYLRRSGYLRAESLPGCSMLIPWHTFEEYLLSMRAGYRRQLMATLRRRVEAGLRVRVREDFGTDCARIYRLYEEVMDRAEFQLERLNLPFFEGLNINLGRQSRAILLERRGELLAAAVMLFTPRAATLLLVGIDYEQNREYHSYFNIVIEAIREAINAGVEVLELGQTSYDLKGRLGGATAQRYVYLKHRNRWLNSMLRTASGLLFPSTTISRRRVFKTGWRA